MLKASQKENVLSWRLKAAWDGILRSDSGIGSSNGKHQ